MIPKDLYAVILYGRFCRLRVFGTYREAVEHQTIQVERLLSSEPAAADAWREAKIIKFEREILRSQQ